MKALEAGKLYGDFPSPLPQEHQDSLKEIQDVLNSAYRDSLISLFCHISNCLNDGHDEASMKRCFPGFIADCINVAGEVQFDSAPTLEEAISKRTPEHGIYISMILQFAKFGSYKIGAGTAAEEAYLEKMQEAEPIIDAALLEDNYCKRWDCVNQLMLFLWPSVRELFPDDPQNQSGSGGSSQPSQGSSGAGQPGSQSGGGNSSNDDGDSQGNDDSQGNTPSPEEVQSALEQMIQELEAAMNTAPAPQNGTGSAVTPAQVMSGDPAPGSDFDGLSQMVQSISQQKAAGQIQQELDKAQMDAIRNTNLPLIHRRVPIQVIRHNPQDEQEYRRISSEIAPVVRNLSKQMIDLFRELNEEHIQRHKRFGPIIEATEAYRPDQTFFAKKKLPDDLPDMALCVLIDQSGSMYGRKLKAAVKTAIMLEQFANNLGIPLMIAGHDVENQVNLRIFTDYVSAMTEQDKYSLAGISDGGCNRDGLPIRLCCELLEQRNERVRLMVVISDGSPNDTNYSGEDARKDISDTVSQFRRKGLLIYGAAIDDDRDVIQEIYGQNFLSIDNLDALPKTLVRLVRQQII